MRVFFLYDSEAMEFIPAQSGKTCWASPAGAKNAYLLGLPWRDSKKGFSSQSKVIVLGAEVEALAESGSLGEF